MMILENYVRRSQHILHRWIQTGREKLPLIPLGCLLAGFVLSAASLGNRLQPLPLAVLCAGLPGWNGLLLVLGSFVGYRIFWGEACLQALTWLAAGLPVSLLFTQTRLGRTMPLLQPALSALIVAAGGVMFQLWKGQSDPILIYLLRVGLAFAGTWLCMLWRDRKDPAAQWLVAGGLVLSLAQIAPWPWLGLGYVAGAALIAVMPFPAVALAGLALDLAGITPVTMTAVLCLSYLLRLLPGIRRGVLAAAPALVYTAVMALRGHLDLMPLLPLLLGGILGVLLPRQKSGLAHRRGETGFAQVRLELASEVMAQSERMLLETAEPAIDEELLIQKALQRACGGCPCRKTCKERENTALLPADLLHRQLRSPDDLPGACKKRGRLLPELRHSQERLRAIKAERDHRQEYRGAVLQQYRFLSEYLQDLADRLPQRGGGSKLRYQPEVAVCASGKEKTNGDKCLWFAGTEGRYYLLLCDGMGTGDDAARAAGTVADMLRRLLMAGYPAPYALRSINSLCALRGDAGAVTVDLAEFCLDNGKVTVYKWGAVASWLLLPAGAECIGAVSTPPGFSTECRESVERLTMRRGEMLVLVSDGVDAKSAMDAWDGDLQEPAGTLAARILEYRAGEDDATVAVIRLAPA